VERADSSFLVFRFDAPPKGTDLEGTPGAGDSGGPVYIGQTIGASGLGSLSVAGVFSSFFSPDMMTCSADAFDAAVSLGDPQVVAWLVNYLGPQNLLGPGYTGTMVDGVWAGPDDVAHRGHDEGRTLAEWDLDPDGDGLVGAHDRCWGVGDPTDEPGRMGSSCMRTVWTPPTSPETCATEMHTERVFFDCLTPSSPQFCTTSPHGELSGDEDLDGIPNACDLCPCDPRPDTDCDGDGIGDHCDSDFASSCAGAIATLRPTMRLDSNVDAEIVFGAPACAAHTDVASCSADSAHS
jgi:hypothetical protein